MAWTLYWKWFKKNPFLFLSKKLKISCRPACGSYTYDKHQGGHADTNDEYVYRKYVFEYTGNTNDKVQER